MFWTRLISGIVLVVIALVTILSGGTVLSLTLLAVSLIGVSELYRVLHVRDKKMSPLALCGYLGVILYYAYDLAMIFFADQEILFLQRDAYTMMVMTGMLVLMMAIYVFTYPRYRSEQVMGAFFSVIYVAVMLSCIYRVRIMEHGIYLVWLVFFGSWGCDTCAYCVGKLIGRHKMTPKLSPKKSVEGAVGGVAGAALLGAVYAAVISDKITTEGNHILVFALICAVAGLISMVGDLAASAIKRNFDIKDYGKLIPGHGGIMDRFDSVIFIAPVIYYLALFLM